MKTDIHPKYQKVKFTCACGASYSFGSTIGDKEYKMDICSACHPFFTGKQKLVDTSGRVERFRKKWDEVKKKQEEEAAKVKKAQSKTEEDDDNNTEEVAEKAEKTQESAEAPEAEAEAETETDETPEEEKAA